MKQDIFKLDLKLFFVRDEISILIISLFQNAEGKKLNKILGFGFSYQIFLIDENQSSWIYLKSDLERINLYHNEFIKKSSFNSIKKLLNKSLDVSRKSQNIFEEIEELSEENINEVFEKISEILLHTTALPYFLLEALKISEVGEDKKKFILETCSKLRGASIYYDLGEKLTEKLEKMGLKDSNFLTYKEVLDFFSKKFFDIEVIKKRKENFIFWSNFSLSDKFYFIYRKNLVEKLKGLIESNNVEPDIKKIFGNIANKGKAKGTVRIINSPKDIDRIKKGEVLVSRNTNPSLMPAILKASAIVTDEGGIGCHAAIVSRELNKPCIIGTIIATKILKDGDLIEVDANKGFIRKTLS